MNIQHELLSATNSEEYEDFLRSMPNSMIYSTGLYREFLHSVLGDVNSTYFLARGSAGLVGALPVFWCKRDGKTVGNSLPYYGSHGDVVVAPEEGDRLSIERGLIDCLLSEASARKAAALNIVTQPFREDHSAFESHGLACVDKRIGQISELPVGGNSEIIQDAILEGCHQKTRNSTRKALAGNFKIEESQDLDDWRELHRLHAINMERVGGQSKSWDQVHALYSFFSQSGAGKLYIARREGVFAGGLVVLLYEQWAEYFIPVSDEEFRSEQVLSAVILRAMTDAAVAGARYWNWGGTWSSQEGVYRFKSRWGARDYLYSYYGQVFDKELLEMSPDAIRLQFPNFYVRPFN
jgi:hypothetical protein